MKTKSFQKTPCERDQSANGESPVVKSRGLVFLAHCHFDKARCGELKTLRAAHLRHILEMRDRIMFGGLTGDDPNAPKALVLAFSAADEAEARALLRKDPYFRTYASVEVTEFQPRIPEERPGQLLDAMLQLEAAAAAN